MSDDDAQTIGAKLKAAIDENDTTISALARLLSARDGTKVKSKRRLLQKYLANGTAPKPPIADWLAEDLGKPKGYFVTATTERRRNRDAVWEAIDEIRARIGDLEGLLRERDGDQSPSRSGRGIP